MIPAFRLDVRVRNNRLIRARERLGYMTQADAERALKLPHGELCGFENFRESPIFPDGRWTGRALRIADALMSDPEDLWPKDAFQVRKSRMSIEATSEQMRELIPSAERRLLLEADASILRAALAELAPREKKILVERIVEERELSDIAHEHNLSRERVRQIVLRGSNKIRNSVLCATREEARRPAKP